ncbi:unnamed protein product [Prorocentrum cordatum]|uniref:Uncharacterized protein n=1 Tax=Prorocentrum cordatum TaxID=2364126 RepID=A0ABN9T9S5_9DINO|nr:unnamed protein product [Polarella glacialis]
MHISFQRVGEVRMAKRGLAEEVAGPRGPGPSGARLPDRGRSGLEGREVDRLRFPSPAFQESARAHAAAVGDGVRAPMQIDATSSGACQSSAEAVDELQISFGSSSAMVIAAVTCCLVRGSWYVGSHVLRETGSRSGPLTQ